MLIILLFSFLSLFLLSVLVYNKKEHYKILGELGRVKNIIRERVVDDIDELDGERAKDRPRYSEHNSNSSGNKKIGLGILRTITKNRKE